MKERELYFDEESSMIKRKVVRNASDAAENQEYWEEGEDEPAKVEESSQQPRAKIKAIQDVDWSEDEKSNVKDELHFHREKEQFQKIQYEYLDQSKKIQKNLKSDELFPTLAQQQPSNASKRPRPRSALPRPTSAPPCLTRRR